MNARLGCIQGLLFKKATDKSCILEKIAMKSGCKFLNPAFKEVKIFFLGGGSVYSKRPTPVMMGKWDINILLQRIKNRISKCT